MRTAETAKGHRHYSTALGSPWTTMAAESGRVHARLVTSTNSMRHAIFTNHRTKLLRARSHERLYGPLLRRENERLASWPAGPRRSARHCPRGHDAVTAAEPAMTQPCATLRVVKPTHPVERSRAPRFPCTRRPCNGQPPQPRAGRQRDHHPHPWPRAPTPCMLSSLALSKHIWTGVARTKLPR
jgi:hypothetical protein